MFTRLALFACSPEHRQAVHDLEVARSVWEAQGPTSYGYTYDQDARIILGPVVIEVEAQDVVDATVIETGETAPDYWWLTVEDLFEQVESVIDARPDSFDVEYDRDFGIPTRMHTKLGHHMSDDVWSFAVDDFESRVED